MTLFFDNDIILTILCSLGWIDSHSAACIVFSGVGPERAGAGVPWRVPPGARHVLDPRGPHGGALGRAGPAHQPAGGGQPEPRQREPRPHDGHQQPLGHAELQLKELEELERPRRLYETFSRGRETEDTPGPTRPIGFPLL